MNPDSNTGLEIQPVVTAADLDTTRRLIREYAASLQGTICVASHEDEMAHLEERYPRSEGGLWLATWNGQAVGCIALRQNQPGQAEIKRLYVVPEFRGRGVARRLMLTALTSATALRYTSVYLALPSMEAAHALYRSLGFRITHASTGPDDPVEMERALP
jgi:ribosomal protein S18 acetylase RimI-like enzyme